MVTLVGVAYRGNIALEGIAVDFEVEPTFANDGVGFSVRESVTLFGKIAESERVRLERASGHCPVGYAMTKGSIQVEDEFQWSTGETVSASPSSKDLHPLDGDLPAIPLATVHAKYLLDTKEHDEIGALTHEGEAKVTVRCANLTPSIGWIILGGHSFQGWVPGSFPLTHAGWAASTVATLGQLLPQNSGEIRVELFMVPSSRGRSESQSNAAEGVLGHRKVFR